MAHKDKEKRKAYDAAYNAAHREKRKAQQRARNAENREAAALGRIMLAMNAASEIIKEKAI